MDEVRGGGGGLGVGLDEDGETGEVAGDELGTDLFGFGE